MTVPRMSREVATIVEAFRAAGRAIPDSLLEQAFTDESERIRADIISRRDRLRARAAVLRTRFDAPIDWRARP